jgi:hypothetical protein
MVTTALQSETVRDNINTLPSELYFASACTGSGSFELVVAAMCDELSEQTGLERMALC